MDCARRRALSAPPPAAIITSSDDGAVRGYLLGVGIGVDKIQSDTLPVDVLDGGALDVQSLVSECHAKSRPDSLFDPDPDTDTDPD